MPKRWSTKVERKKWSTKGTSRKEHAEREPSTHVNTLVCLRPRADIEPAERESRRGPKGGNLPALGCKKGSQNGVQNASKIGTKGQKGSQSGAKVGKKAGKSIQKRGLKRACQKEVKKGPFWSHFRSILDQKSEKGPKGSPNGAKSREKWI